MLNGIKRRKMLEEDLIERQEMSKIAMGIVLSDCAIDIFDDQYFFRTKDFTINTDANYRSICVIENGLCTLLSATEAKIVIPLLQNAMFNSKVVKK